MYKCKLCGKITCQDDVMREHIIETHADSIELEGYYERNLNMGG